MKEEQQEKINECAELLLKTIQEYTGTTKCLVQWGTLQDIDKNRYQIASGSKVGEMSNRDLEQLAFELLGRLYIISEKE